MNSIDKLATAIQLNTEMTFEEAKKEACERVDNMTLATEGFKMVEIYCQKNLEHLHKVGYSPDGGMFELSVDIYNVRPEDREAVRRIIYALEEELEDPYGLMILTHIVTPEETQKYYPEHYRENDKEK